MITKKILTPLICSLCLVLTQPAWAGSKVDDLTNDAVKVANKTINLVKDSSITAYIYAQIALDNNLSQLNINVTTDKGVVTLEGTVNADSEAGSAIQIASSAAGVTAVDASHLKVKKSSQPFTDMVITAKVKGTFIREKLFDDKDLSNKISVETKNGVVYLSGTAASSTQVQNARKLVQAISGVSRVESTIEVVKVEQPNN